MRTTPRLCIAVGSFAVIASLVAGCGGSTSNAGSKPQTVTSQPAIPVAPAPAKLAHDNGLRIIDAQEPTKLAINLAGAADAVGHLFDIATFDNGVNRDDWLRAALAIPGTKLLIKGPLYAIIRIPKRG